MRLARRSGLHKRAPPPVYRQSRAEKSPPSGLAKGRGSCLLVPSLWLVNAVVEAVKSAERWGGLRKCHQRRQSNQRKEVPARPQTMQPFNRFALVRAGNRLRDAV